MCVMYVYFFRSPMCSEFPIRCWSCGKVVASKLSEYENLVEQGVTKEKALNTIGMVRYCCRRMFLGYVNLSENLKHYEKNNDTTFNEYKYTVTGIAGFTAFQIKIVMKGSISSYPPRIRDLRGIALAV